MYYLRYATGKKGVMLEFSVQQLVTSEPEVILIPEAQPTQSLPHSVVFWHILVVGSDSHAPTCLSFGWLCAWHHWPSTEAHLLSETSTLWRCFPLDPMSRVSYLLSWFVCRRLSYSWTKRFLCSRHLDFLLPDRDTLYRFLPWILLTPKSRDEIFLRGGL
jgi:hypothetical protein